MSKSWKALIDTCKTKGTAELELKTRQHQLPLLKGLFLVCTTDTQVFITREREGDEKQGAAYYAVERLRGYRVWELDLEGQCQSTHVRACNHWQ
ncbi:hypothetical protein GOP47_0015637 [Adiantum capillus-veneris]|uniref:Uncharacterized protein n=1 Tax=Adiantum capillus-veneris TaxID=13818 RepID=A0A9D4UK32_ADICA|nr:hypothetical protein GOP47_0015637 [Adiantum capillus-veneris]